MANQMTNQINYFFTKSSNDMIIKFSWDGIFPKTVKLKCKSGACRVQFLKYF